MQKYNTIYNHNGYDNDKTNQMIRQYNMVSAIYTTNNQNDNQTPYKKRSMFESFTSSTISFIAIYYRK